MIIKDVGPTKDIFNLIDVQALDFAFEDHEKRQHTQYAPFTHLRQYSYVTKGSHNGIPFMLHPKRKKKIPLKSGIH